MKTKPSIMKTKLLTAFLIVLWCTIFSNTTLAQRDAGGSSAGGGNYSGSNSPDCIIQPSPVSFKRNNGQGTCGGDGQIRLSFNQNPTEAPVLTALMYEDGSPITYISVPIIGDVSDLAKKGYISYCLMGGNIDPAKKVIAVFHYQGGCQEDTILYQ